MSCGRVYKLLIKLLINYWFTGFCLAVKEPAWWERWIIPTKGRNYSFFRPHGRLPESPTVTTLMHRLAAAEAADGASSMCPLVAPEGAEGTSNVLAGQASEAIIGEDNQTRQDNQGRQDKQSRQARQAIKQAGKAIRQGSQTRQWGKAVCSVGEVGEVGRWGWSVLVVGRCWFLTFEGMTCSQKEAWWNLRHCPARHAWAMETRWVGGSGYLVMVVGTRVGVVLGTGQGVISGPISGPVFDRFLSWNALNPHMSGSEGVSKTGPFLDPKLVISWPGHGQVMDPSWPWPV